MGRIKTPNKIQAAGQIACACGCGRIIDADRPRQQKRGYQP